MSNFNYALLLAPAVLLLSSCGSDENKQSTTTANATSSPVTEAPKASQAKFGNFGIDLTTRDLSVRPGDDFFNYTNGTWLKNNEIPAARTSTGVSLLIHEQAQERVKGIIEALAAKNNAMGTPEQKVGDYYASWMDIATVNKRGISPLQLDLDRIKDIKDVTALTREFGQTNYISGISPIAQSLGIDPKDPDKYNHNIGLGGLGLPDRDYYLQDSERFIKIRADYLSHIEEMLNFANYKNTAEMAGKILALETKIAGHQWVRSDRRDRDKLYNPTKVAELDKQYPNFDWQAFLNAAGIKGLKDINVSHPNTIKPLIEMINTLPLATWKAYLSYHIISNNAGLLSTEIDAANFKFWGTALSGRKVQLDRWKRGVSRVGAKSGLGEALGQVYVKLYFPESSKAQMQVLVENLRDAYEERIEHLDWMTEDTKVEAQAKLASFRAKIGYPDNWMDLSAISIKKDDLFGNARRVLHFFEAFDVARLGRPTDREEWFMTPQTVNAYYLSNFNEIVFPAAILEPPYFDPSADPAINYGAIGSIIGHEMGHGFDDQGSKSDAKGVKRNWWTDADRAAFEIRTKALGKQFDAYEAVPGEFVDGDFTMGENIGDLGGIAVAYRAYQLSLNGKPASVIDGISGDQRFFLAYAQSWRGKVREEALLRRLKSDPHSPAIFRVNGIVRNLDAWYQAFDVKEGDALYLAPEKRIAIW